MAEQEIIQEFRKLNPAEKILLVEELWDTIGTDQEEIPVPEWHLKELDDRYAGYKSGNMELYDWEDMHREIRKRLK